MLRPACLEVPGAHDPGSTRQQPLVRIDLREVSVLEGPVGGADLGNIGEDAEGEEGHQTDAPHKLATSEANGQ